MAELRVPSANSELLGPWTTRVDVAYMAFYNLSWKWESLLLQPKQNTFKRV